jgi:hypothetical protein
VLTVLLVAALPASADARRAPQNFYGVSWDAGLNARPDADQDSQWDLMASSGVESARVVFSWAAAQPGLRGPFRFEATDRLVARAAKHRIQLLPTVFEAPAWAMLDPSRRNSPPRYVSDYAAYLRALVERYGPRGSFWPSRPDVPRRPIREWQIWNEPDLTFYWNVPSDWTAAWPRGYVKLLKAAHRAIKSRDRRAKVVLAGLSNKPWVQLRRLYRLKARRLFDVVAIHPYNSGPKDAMVAIKTVRGVMRRRRDRRKPIWVTELGWPAARGKLSIDGGLRRLVTTERGMADRIRTAYSTMLRTRRSKLYGVGRLYWFTWASSYAPRGEGGIWNYAGLVAALPKTVVATAGFYAYRSSARSNQGCAKTVFGTCR